MSANIGFSNPLFWPLTLIFAGVLIMMMNLNIIPSTAWALWPVGLVVVGLVGLAGSVPAGTTTRRASKPAKKKRK